MWYFMKRIFLFLSLLASSSIAFANNGIDRYKALSDGGDPESAYKLGMVYYFGVDGEVNVNVGDAVKYLTLAEERGVARASTILGKHYFDNNNYKEATKHFKLASVKGERLALSYLGKIMEDNDKDGAERLYRASVRGGSAAPLSYLMFGQFLINKYEKGSTKSLEGYAILINLKLSGKDTKMEVDRFLRINDYKFNERDREVLNQLRERYKI